MTASGIAMQIFSAAERVEGRPVLAWSLAGLVFLLALGLRFWAAPHLPTGYPFVTFFPAVMVAAFLCGLLPGIAVAIVSGLSAWYFFVGPANSLPADGATLFALAFYLLIVSTLIALIEAMRRSARSLQDARETAARLAEQRRAMFQELQHRVANNMQFAASLLNLQKRQIAREPASALAAVDEARARMDTIARIHRRLYDPARIDEPIGAYLQELLGDIVEASGKRNVVCHVTAQAVRLDLSTLTNLSLVVVEIATNALKHAFVDRDRGTITVSMERVDEGRLCLTISDDGPGAEVYPGSGSQGSLGHRIIDSLVEQMGGRITYVSDGGLTARLAFPG